MAIRRLLVLISLVGLACASACTINSQGDPKPANTTETADSGSSPRTSGNGNEELPYAGAPKVNNPLDTSRFEKDPCQSLTADQAQSLNVPATGTINDNAALATACDWKNPTTRGFVEIAFIVDDPYGLSQEYDAKNRGEFPNFKELPKIDGYPAITRDGADKWGGCTVVVGVADDMSFEASVELSQANIGKKDPCDVAVQVAGLALQTMKSGG